MARGDRGGIHLLQVKEALMTSALLKLPQNLSRSRKEERVEQILEELVCPLYSTTGYISQQRCMLLPGDRANLDAQSMCGTHGPHVAYIMRHGFLMQQLCMEAASCNR